MIPRFKPYVGTEELVAIFGRHSDSVSRFECEFARTFEARQALAFPYGRSALWAFFKALGIVGTEIIMPAYTCVVVAHAIVLSGNTPRFVDITLCDYNMDLDQVESAINERTQAIVATHLFGYPLDVERLSQIVRQAEARYGHKIWIIQDCAHSFGARWKGKLVCNEGDVALFGLNISKTITSIFGGMLTSNDAVLTQTLREWRDSHFVRPSAFKASRRSLYLLAIYPAFNEAIYGLVDWLQENTPLLNRLTKAYHLDEMIQLPPDYADQMLGVEARIGLIQLSKYAEIVRRRHMNACYYKEHLQTVPGLDLPPIVDGATYSHFVIRVPDRSVMLRTMKSKGIQLGQLIEYSVPNMEAYAPYGRGHSFPNSLVSSRTTVNLPIYAGMTDRQRAMVANLFANTALRVRNRQYLFRAP